ncbi:uncharacterized protein LOC105441958 isoform X2 [Strongylocentrotus purpuratus]|uniref:Transposase n=1 Tax=Strongylocentrotus purpuratus TaxID=7668 RepID=A0A7M7NJZ5_STRPU|nr:uncharacterized protein LOC105441958 isoform X2 [Strongylocentrotus purpuratus]
MPNVKPKRSVSAEKLARRLNKLKYENTHKAVWVKMEYFEELQRIAKKEKLRSTGEAAAVAIESYSRPNPTPKAMTPQAVATCTGSQTPMSVARLPFFNSPRVPKFNESECNRSLNDDNDIAYPGPPFPESDEMHGVEPLLNSDEDVTDQDSGRPTLLQGPSHSKEDSDSNFSVECIEKGNFIYPQERSDDIKEEDDDENWHPNHEQNKSKCKNLPTIRDDEEVFGVLEEDAEVSCSGLHHKLASALVAASTKLFLVTDSMIKRLAQQARPTCGMCRENNQVDVVEAGTSAHIVWTCQQGHTSRLCMQETVNGSHVGDMKLASSILLSGNNFLKVKRLADFMNLHMFSSRLFSAMQSHYLCPVIEAEFEATINATRTKLKNQEIAVCGDARNDSPGFCAQYCTYTLLDHHTKEILAAEFLDKRETKDRSGGMEPEGLVRALKSLKDHKVNVKEVITDAHPTISAIIRKDYPEIVHSWDVWHGAKNLGKKISKASTVAANKSLRKWTKKVVNHFWFCSETCEGNTQLFLSKWRGLVHHVTNQHEWGITGGLGGVAHCEHGDIDEREEEEWLKSGTKAHDALVKIILDKRFLNTLVKFINFRHTGELESLHSHILMYCSKRFSFGYQAYRARNMLAMIDYSKHKDRPIALDAEGEPKCRSKWSKHSADWVIFEVKVPKTYSYILGMMEEILHRRLTDTLPLYCAADPHPNDPRRIRERLAPFPPPPMEDLKARRRSRFST